jgi:hypothetical protein
MTDGSHYQKKGDFIQAAILCNLHFFFKNLHRTRIKITIHES